MSKKDPEDFRKILGEIARKKSDLLSVFSDFCRMAACALALQTREEEYLEISGKYDRAELDRFGQALGCLTFEMEKHPFDDILGVYYMEVGAKSVRDMRGEFFTPKSLCSLIASMVTDVDQVKEQGKPITVNDPAAGSGGIILSLAESFAPDHIDLLRVTCQDISRLACDMCYINMTLWSIPAKIIWGDTLRMTVDKVWCNMHWYRVGEPLREQIQAMDKLLFEKPQTAETTVNPIMIPTPEKRSQASFEF